MLGAVGGVGGRNNLCKFESVHKYSRLKTVVNIRKVI